MIRSHHILVALTAAALLALDMLPAAPAKAADNSWDGKGSGNWSDATRWSLGRTPDSTDLVIVGGPSDQTISLTSPLNQAQALTVGSDTGATITVSSGINTALDVAGNLALGQVGRGVYNLNGGTLSAAGEFVGYTALLTAGVGTLSHTGGSNNVSGDLAIGTIGNGTYNLSGSGVLTVKGTERVGWFGGIGAVNQSDGVHTAKRIEIGSDHLGNGSYNLSGNGTLMIETERIGVSGGAGTFNQSGGLHSVAIELDIGASGGNGTYKLSGNGLLRGELDIGIGLGTGTFIQSGGTVQSSLQFVGHGAAGPSRKAAARTQWGACLSAC